LASMELINYFLIPSYVERQRLQGYSLYWQYYLGDQWETLREEGETLITMNYCKAFVDKSVAFLFGKGFSFQFAEELNDVKELVNEFWDYNRREVVGIEMGQMGGITGDCFVKVYVEEAEVSDDEDTLYDELYPNGKVKISVLHSSICFPTYSPHNREKMTQMIIEYPVVTPHPITGSDDVHIYKEIIDRDTIQYFTDGQLTDEIANPIREINVVHIPNIPLAGYNFGQSDVVNVFDLQDEYNEKSTDVSDIINYHAAPVTIITGAKAKDLEKGAKKIWGGLPLGAKVENLELTSDLAASNTFIASIKTAMHELSNTPEDSLGATAAISNTSGVALEIKYAPLLEKTWIKRQTYGFGLKKITMMALKLLRAIGMPEEVVVIDKVFKDRKLLKKLARMSVIWPDPLPKDKLVQIQILAQKMKLGLEEPEGALQELGFDGDITKKLAAIAEYQKNQQELLFEQAGGGADITGEEPVVDMSKSSGME